MSRQDNPTTVAALKRKVQRLEAELAALQAFLTRDRDSEYLMSRRNAEMRVRIDQALQILQGKD